MLFARRNTVYIEKISLSKYVKYKYMFFLYSIKNILDTLVHRSEFSKTEKYKYICNSNLIQFLLMIEILKKLNELNKTM